MKTKKHIAGILAIALLSLGACKKDDKETSSPPVSKSEILTGSNWNLTHEIQETYLNDSLIHREAESVNARVNFTTDNLVIASIPGEQPDTSVWAFVGDEFFINNMAHQVEEITTEQFIFSYSDTEKSPGGTVEMRSIFNLKKQE